MQGSWCPPFYPTDHPPTLAYCGSIPKHVAVDKREWKHVFGIVGRRHAWHPGLKIVVEEILSLGAYVAIRVMVLEVVVLNDVEQSFMRPQGGVAEFEMQGFGLDGT